MFAAVFENLLQGLAQMRAHKLRSLLTLLGIFIGIAAIIGSSSLLDAVNRMVVRNFERWGSLTTVGFNHAWGEYKEGRWQHFDKVFPLGDADVAVIRENVENAAAIATFYETWGQGRVRHGAATVTGVQIVGCSEGYDGLSNIEMAGGRFIETEDVEDWVQTAVLSAQLKENLFGAEDPVGKEIIVAAREWSWGEPSPEMRFRVVGHAKPRGTSTRDERTRLFVPLTTARHRLLGYSSWDGLNILVKAKSTEDVAQIKADVVRLLTARNPGSEARHFEAWSLGEWSEEALKDVKTQGYILYGVAFLCLLTGGIGIMNIMLVSVSERTREIGLRKAVGARTRHILLQFLLEAVLLSLVGGALGIAGGWAVGQGFSTILADTMSEGETLDIALDAAAIAVALGTSCGVALVFGIFPALKAARLHPIEALRYE
jgi:ABC-type antimicrobial peptide transport system permease subunit